MSATCIRSMCRRRNQAYEAVYHFSSNSVREVVTGFSATRATEVPHTVWGEGGWLQKRGATFVARSVRQAASACTQRRRDSIQDRKLPATTPATHADVHAAAQPNAPLPHGPYRVYSIFRSSSKGRRWDRLARKSEYPEIARPSFWHRAPLAPGIKSCCANDARRAALTAPARLRRRPPLDRTD